MAWDFKVIGWEDEEGNIQRDRPSDIDDTYGMKVFAYDEETGETAYFWSYIGEPFEEWGEWLDYIGIQMEDHGMEF